MAYLYELEGIYAQLQSMDLDEEIFQDTLDSIDFQSDLENNIEYFVKMLKNVQADAEMYKAEKEAFYKKQKQAEAKAEKYKETIRRAMELSQKKKVDAGMFKVSLRRSKKVEILDETKIPLDYMQEKIEYKPMKSEISKALKPGIDISGVELIETESLQVK
ncbi:TPA: siphovirus Gp157 family protein [Streptococcus pyogenes]|uniref:siphovirus Gp157 family protein n=1 Tax=Streptococcus pyogenes TaxID=1314 RepID=UPI0010C31FD1|nr:siphovirus Gp157 family protein [Streptococcus pyogenes]VTR14792.1 phage protein [Streptococcus pyogenes]HEP1510576.1 siphovirus Gp157 family protein [Streptococcus pyogenes]HER0886552.1 siphovirus Gp157 family protein [Streptococcus pyogenes]HER0889968.1 siphovirus Gp157 family protein [Streptococcus pyogenes]HER0893336.1 siphovirus Gp157 family protein [Streptococcus pyogenes]